MELSVGTASGLIAVAIALLQFVIPNALIFVLVAALSQEHNAVTWSVVSRSLSNSIWPTILRSDMSTSRGVPTSISIITWAKPLCLALIAVAAVMTPIGLYEDLAPSTTARLVPFVAVDDTGTMGSGTPPRSDLGFSRGCGGLVLMQCPDTTVVIDVTRDANWTNSTTESGLPYDRRVPKLLAQLYQSGLPDQARSVSSYFDIQSRQYSFKNEQGLVNNDTYLVDGFQPIGSMIMSDTISLVDGLIVDMRNGGVGFRKHTIPTGLQYGAEWDEDVLFLQPETVCVDMNMTLEVQVPGYDIMYDSSAPTGILVDKGGWVHMNKTSPYLDPWFEDLQTSLLSNGDPSLRARAYRAGWWTNVLNMYFFNISKPDTNRTAYLTSHFDQRFPVNTSSFGYATKDQLLFGTWNNIFSNIPSGYLWPNGTVDISNYSYGGPPYWSNPWNISSLNYSDIGSLCTGSLGGDKANMTNIDVQCGLLLGPSTRLDGNVSNIYAPGSWWTRPIYSCASATKATIKTVHFTYNSSFSGGLNSLNATKISDKAYNNRSEMPLWGVETPNMNISDFTPFWGLISPQLENNKSVNLSTTRAEKLYIPASMVTWFQQSLGSQGMDFLPGTQGSPEIWHTVYDYYGTSLSGFDYTGSTNLALLQKWRGLLTNTTGGAEIINLIWTDYAANYFVGTRSWLTPTDSLPPNLQRTNQKREVGYSEGQVPVHVYQRKIRYHYLYGIPAAICLVLAAAVCAGAFLSILLRRSSAGRLRYYIYSLSSGRLFGAFLFPTEGDPRAETKTWIKQVGHKHVRLPDPTVTEKDPIASAKAGHYSLVNQKDTTNAAITTAIEIDERDSSSSQRSTT